MEDEKESTAAVMLQIVNLLVVQRIIRCDSFVDVTPSLGWTTYIGPVLMCLMCLLFFFPMFFLYASCLWQWWCKQRNGIVWVSLNTKKLVYSDDFIMLIMWSRNYNYWRINVYLKSIHDVSGLIYFMFELVHRHGHILYGLKSLLKRSFLLILLYWYRHDTCKRM